MKTYYDFGKDEVPFTQVANEVLQDKDLSWKAKGIYAYLYSKPSTWQFSATRMAKESGDGRSATLEALKELEKAGLLRRKRLGNGRVTYWVTYPPHNFDPKFGNQTLDTDPQFDFPTVRKSHGAETEPVSNKDNTSNKEEESNTIAEASSASKVFDLKGEIKKLSESPRSELKLIGWFIERKNLDLKSKDQLSVTIKRHLRSAKLVVPFSRGDVARMADVAESQIADKWTIETIYKLLTK